MQNTRPDVYVLTQSDEEQNESFIKFMSIIKSRNTQADMDNFVRETSEYLAVRMQKRQKKILKSMS